MKISKNLILTLFCVLLCSVSTIAQNALTGKVTEVIDGRTAVFTAEKGAKFTILLGNIEVPEPEQELSKVVKQHLEVLALNKEARFIADNQYSQGYAGKLFVSGNEINKQMIRDGAAWYNLPENQIAPDRGEYLELENVAKAEKRGVWGVANLKPAWIFREEKYNKEIEAKNLERKKAAEKAATNSPLSNGNIAWMGFTGISGKDSLPYRTSYDKFPDVTQYVTDLMPVAINKFQEKFSMSFYVQESFYGQQFSKDTKLSYFISFMAKGSIVLFDYSSDLSLICGKERIHLERPEHKYDVKGSIYDENDPRTEFVSNRFQMTEEEFKIFRNTKQVEFKIGGYEGTLSEGQMNAVRSLPQN